MKIELKDWEVARIREILEDNMDAYTYDSVSFGDESGRACSMSIKTFLEKVERDLKDPYK